MSRGRPVAGVFDIPLVRAYQDSSAEAIEFFKRWVEAGRPIGLGILSTLDLLARSRDEGDRTDWLFFIDNIAVVLTLTPAGVARAEDFLRTSALPCVLSADDALVAATAIVRKLPLYSLDPERYAGVAGLTVLPAR
jgi:predicted nucleic acid-binding protein